MRDRPLATSVEWKLRNVHLRFKDQVARPKKDTVKARILEAWDGGERSIYEIMEITGYDFNTIHQYIPLPGERN